MSTEKTSLLNQKLGFVPHRLEIPDRPELNNFPFNVMFAQYTTNQGKLYIADAIYSPVLDSYQETEEKASMKYLNSYGTPGELLIEYELRKKRYLGIKTVDGKYAGEASGAEWKMFFVHFTMLGLTVGERCNFDSVESLISKS